MEVIEAKNLMKTFGDLVAVNRISLLIGEGELFGLLGPNGSGKTTTIKLLTGQLKPTDGRIKVMGIDVIKHPVEVRKRIGIIPEQETPPSFLTAEEYLHFVGKIRGINDVERECRWWFKFLEMEEERRTLCKDLSRGMKQKLMFAQCFLHHPKLAFVDEPLMNLDPIMQRKVKNYLKNFAEDGGTIFFSTHVLEIAEEICTRVAIIYEGEIIYDISMEEIRKEGKNLEEVFLKAIGRRNDGDI